MFIITKANTTMTPLTTNRDLDSFMQAVIVTDAQRQGARVTNEQDQMNFRESSAASDCCNAQVIYEGLHTFCDDCGNYCGTH